MKTKLQQFIEKLESALFSNQHKASVAKKLENPEKLAEQIVREIGSDSQPLKFK